MYACMRALSFDRTKPRVSGVAIYLNFCRKTAKGGEETRPDQLIRSRAHTGGRSNVDWHPPSRAASQRATLPCRHPLTTALCQPTSTRAPSSLSRSPSARVRDFPSVETFSSFLICPFSPGAPPPLPLARARPPIPLPLQNSNNLQPTVAAAVAAMLFMPYKVFTCKSETSRSGACFA